MSSNYYDSPLGLAASTGFRMHNYTSVSGFDRQMSLAKQPLVRPVHFRSINVASAPSANVRWASTEAVNFMDHLYFITNLVLDYLLENDLPQELMNQTLLNDPVSVLTDHKNELITHFHKLLIAACTCLCIGISIPLFGFMLMCCWCSRGNSSSSKPSGVYSERAQTRPNARSRSHHRRESSDREWLALANRDSPNSYQRSVVGSRQHREQDRRRRHARNHRRSGGTSAPGATGMPYRSRSIPPSMKYESSCHPCLRTFFSSNLFIILLLISFFAVCAFVTNEYVSSGVKHFPKALNQSMDEIQSYLNNTDYEIDNLFRVNYNQLENEVNLRLDTSGVIIKHKLAVNSEAIALVNLTNIVSEFNDTKVRLEKLDRELLILKSRLSTAKRSLDDFRTRLQNCLPEHCLMLKRKYSNVENFRILPQYEKLPELKNLIKKITDLLNSGIVTEVQKSKDDFDKFGAVIQREVDSTTPEVKKQFATVGKRLSAIAADISQSIRWSDSVFNQTRSSTKRLVQYTEYEQYRRYACLGGAFVISFVLLCYTSGWLYGSCRPQPTARTYRTHAKTSASATFPFSCGIFVVFLLFLPMILSAIALFLTGSVGDKIVCRVIKHPEQKQSKQIYAMLQNKFLNAHLSISNPNQDDVLLEKHDGKELKTYRPNYADLIARCHQNQSIYKVLKLDQYDRVYLHTDHNIRRLAISLDRNFNVDSSEFKRINNIDAKLKSLNNYINFDTSRLTLLTPEAERILKLSMGLSFDEIEDSFARLYNNGVNISPIDIDQFHKDVQAQRASLKDDADTDLPWLSLQSSIFNEQILPNITSSLLSLKDGVRHLKLRALHGKNSFGTVITDLLIKVRSAETQLKTNGKALLKISANEFIDDLTSLIDQYATHMKNQIENVIGQCEPVSRAINSTTSTFCDDIILPFNGYWLSTLSALLLILPATFLAYALKGLYQLARRGPHIPHNYSFTDQEDEISYEDDGEDIALAYHLGHHSHHHAHKPSSSTAAPSAPPAANEDNWSPAAAGYVHNARPPPYAV